MQLAGAEIMLRVRKCWFTVYNWSHLAPARQGTGSAANQLKPVQPVGADGNVVFWTD